MTEKKEDVHILTANSFLAQTFQVWNIYMEDQGLEINTIKSYNSDLRILASYFPLDTTIGSITTEQLNSYLTNVKSQEGMKYSEKSLSRHKTSIKAFFR